MNVLPVLSYSYCICGVSQLFVEPIIGIVPFLLFFEGILNQSEKQIESEVQKIRANAYRFRSSHSLLFSVVWEGIYLTNV